MMAAFEPTVRVPVSDLNAAARIRNAALEGFAANGVAATSIRDVAAAAGVSPGLVQHHRMQRLRETPHPFQRVLRDLTDFLGI